MKGMYTNTVHDVTYYTTSINNAILFYIIHISHIILAPLCMSESKPLICKTPSWVSKETICPQSNSSKEINY